MGNITDYCTSDKYCCTCRKKLSTFFRYYVFDETTKILTEYKLDRDKHTVARLMTIDLPQVPPSYESCSQCIKKKINYFNQYLKYCDHLDYLKRLQQSHKKKVDSLETYSYSAFAQENATINNSIRSRNLTPPSSIIRASTNNLVNCRGFMCKNLANRSCNICGNQYCASCDLAHIKHTVALVKKIDFSHCPINPHIHNEYYSKCPSDVEKFYRGEKIHLR